MSVSTPTTLAAKVATSTQHLSALSLSRRWGISVGHLANLRSAGLGVTYLKLGSVVRYRLSDVETYESAAIVSAVT